MNKTPNHLFFAVVLICATIANADSLTKQFPDKIDTSVHIKAHPFALEDVRLLDGPFKNAMDLNGKWLLDLEPDRFLSWFRKEAGLEPKAEVYGGWEKNTIAGHSLGHYMSACAMMYASTGNNEYKNRLAYIVDELAACQKAHGNGYMSAFPNGKKALQEVSRGQIRSKGFDLNGIWVPWYTQHKLLAGLRDTYVFTHSKKALEVWDAHAGWIAQLLANLTDDQWQNMLACEHGGINETFADLYGVTANKTYLDIARKFYHKSVLEPLSQKTDSITGLHANTQVPKIIGAARIYELTGDDKFKTIADFFWQTVVDHYTYANGGNSAGEYFGKPDHLAAKMHDTTETCNTYNMLKLTRHVFAWNPTAKHMDYYERALLNHILAHQHPEQGGKIVYKGFLDMPARKGFSHPTNSFWCCVGTGMENHTKYTDTIYSYNRDTLYVNLFIPSKLNWKDKGITLTQKTNFPTEDKSTLTFSCNTPTKLSLKIRKPYWAKEITVKLNGNKQQIAIGEDGFIKLTRKFKTNDQVVIEMPMQLHRSTLPDRPSRTAFLHGPTLLAAQLDDGEKSPMLVGKKDQDILQAFKQTKPQEFTATEIGYQITDSDLKSRTINMTPLYKIAEQPYTVYMDVFSPSQWQQKKAEYQAEQKRIRQLEVDSVDVLYIGQMQPERDHNLTGEGTGTGQFNGRKWRHAYNGFFEFDMKVLSDKPTDLLCTYWGSERGSRTFDLLVDGNKIATQKLENNKPPQFFDVRYKIPTDLTKGKNKVRVRFKSHPNNYAGGLFGVRTIKSE